MHGTGVRRAAMLPYLTFFFKRHPLEHISIPVVERRSMARLGIDGHETANFPTHRMIGSSSTRMLPMLVRSLLRQGSAIPYGTMH